MLGDFISKNKKYIRFWIIATIILEAIFLIKMKDSGSSIMIVAGILYIPVILIILTAMTIDWHYAIYALAVSIPILPVNGYIFNRIGLLEYQCVAYILFYLVFIYSIFKNGVYKRLKFNIKLNFYNIIIGLMLILSIINTITAFNKFTSFTLLSLSLIPAVAYFSFIYFLDVEDNKKLVDNVILFVCAGVAISSIPDVLTFFVLWAMNLKTSRIYGPLGSNFILAYSLLVYPIIIVNSKIKQGLEGKIYKALLIIIMFSLSTQFSRGIYLAVIIMFIIIMMDIKHLKTHLAVFLVVMVFLSINVFQRPEVSKNPNLDLSAKGGVSSQLKKQKNLENEAKFIASQSSNRKPIWGAAIKMFKDYPLTGVGTGNFKYFFEYYSNTDREYLDAHNFVLNNLAESGIIFTSLLMLLILSMLFTCGISLFKHWKNYDIRLKNIIILSSILSYLAFGNITGAAFQSINEIYSFTPMFVFCFFIFYYMNSRYTESKNID